MSPEDPPGPSSSSLPVAGNGSREDKSASSPSAGSILLVDLCNCLQGIVSLRVLFALNSDKDKLMIDSIIQEVSAQVRKRKAETARTAPKLKTAAKTGDPMANRMLQHL